MDFNHPNQSRDVLLYRSRNGDWNIAEIDDKRVFKPLFKLTKAQIKKVGLNTEKTKFIN